MVGDLGTARLKKGRGKVLSDDDRRRRIRNRKRLALANRKIGEDLLADSFKRAKGV